MELKELTRAKENFYKCLDLNPTYYPSMIGLANVLYSEFNYVKSEDLLRQAIALEPNDSHGHISLGNTLMAMKVIKYIYIEIHRSNRLL